MQENQDNAANNPQQNGEKDKKNKQRDLKKLQRKIDIIKEGEIKAKQKYFQESKIDYDQFYETQYQNFRNPSLNGWRVTVKQAINEIDEKMNTDKYFIQFLTSIGRVYIQRLVEDAIEIKESGESDERVHLTEDHIREAYRKQKNHSRDIDQQQHLKKIFD
ncbi:hTAFII28-like motif protein (macronuclear) [Tetrahymena thermophila SB210]|uniref:HTAFII28-like motif protein n=1 Tax=Tetrahymena thermophila (strain SB210) TaxID=312017 RepID=W7X557_TETTS|nr:hTAFII28-like motif protein [Tetrahymena thermophila SB210]EWS71508.1 hTAFII28-like motif protein [Tetrahymena thermophila SB210]|eukprot:XP_012655953.1 hTAFII28-like motif protein [Tetrahymena thermophila SB210]